MTKYYTYFIDNNFSTSWDSSSISKNDNFPLVLNDIRKKIHEMTYSKSNISFMYRETLRSILNCFKDIVIIDGEDKLIEIQCIHGSQERVVAKLNQEKNLILPIISISQTTSDNDNDRRKYESVLVNERVWDKEKNRAYRILSMAPRPINIKYQLHVWSKYLSDMDQVLEQIRLKFNPEMNVPTKFSTITKAYLESENNNGTYTPDDKEDRVIRKTLDIVVRTYIPNPKFLVTSTGKIEKLNIETK